MTDDGLLRLPPAERYRLNREIGEEIWRTKKEEDARRKRQEIIQSSLQPVYWPFGLPGGGAPNPYTNRRLKFRDLLPQIHEDGPLPRLPSVRRRFKYSDPQLRFQYHPDVRRSVDIHWRYGFPPEIKSAYRLDLERQMEEKRRRRAEERGRLPQAQGGLTDEFGLPGPGGQQWRHPSRIGMNFLHSLGWTGEKAFRRLEDQIEGRGPNGQLMIKDKSHNTFTTLEDALTGGVELVPLMARRRSFKKNSHLPSCDVTNTAILNPKESWQDTPAGYHRDLNAQVNDKRGQAKAKKDEDVKTSKKHFETWNTLWGRPGHGAPRAGGAKAKGHLGRLLYHESGVLWPGSAAQRLR